MKYVKYVMEQAGHKGTEMGPELEISKIIHAEKYRNRGESFEEMCDRIAHTLSDNKEHYDGLIDILMDQRFLPGGRIQKDIGSVFSTTAFNCFVSGTIEDSMEGIMLALGEAAETMRRGGGIGYDFSTLRPRGDIIRTLNSKASGPISYMDIFDALCGTIQSAGHRRGAQMGVLRVDHPDILEFINVKSDPSRLTRFNVSVAVTDDFMKAVKDDTFYYTQFNGQKYSQLRASKVWDMIMKNTWDHAEPGVLFIDRINEQNPLYYCERIATTNPCGEVPLPPYGACLLGSFNVVKYLKKNSSCDTIRHWEIDLPLLKRDIPTVVRGMDNVIENTNFPLDKQHRS
jgi:ribonucleoside-diphosphate reductase alpha chain